MYFSENFIFQILQSSWSKNKYDPDIAGLFQLGLHEKYYYANLLAFVCDKCFYLILCLRLMELNLE